jgi:hypothetical protein
MKSINDDRNQNRVLNLRFKPNLLFTVGPVRIEFTMEGS